MQLSIKILTGINVNITQTKIQSIICTFSNGKYLKNSSIGPAKPEQYVY